MIIDSLTIAGFFPADDRVSQADREGMAVFDALADFVDLARAVADRIAASHVQ